MSYAYKHFQQIEVVPIYLSTCMLSNIIVGGICLNEFKEYSNYDFVYFGIGTFICITGMLSMMVLDEM